MMLMKRLWLASFRIASMIAGSGFANAAWTWAGVRYSPQPGGKPGLPQMTVADAGVAPRTLAMSAAAAARAASIGVREARGATVLARTAILARRLDRQTLDRCR